MCVVDFFCVACVVYDVSVILIFCILFFVCVYTCFLCVLLCACLLVCCVAVLLCLCFVVCDWFRLSACMVCLLRLHTVLLFVVRVCFLFRKLLVGAVCVCLWCACVLWRCCVCRLFDVVYVCLCLFVCAVLFVCVFVLCVVV